MLRGLRAVISNSIQVAVEYGINAGTGGDGGRCVGGGGGGWGGGGGGGGGRAFKRCTPQSTFI